MNDINIEYRLQQQHDAYRRQQANHYQQAKAGQAEFLQNVHKAWQKLVKAVVKWRQSLANSSRTPQLDY